MTRKHLFAVVAAVTALAASSALALPRTGSDLPALSLRDAWDRTYDLSPGLPVLLVYEDRDSATQNDALKKQLATLAKGDVYKKRIALVAVADVSEYDFWPARGFVKDAIKEESTRQGTAIYCDWTGSVRSSLRLDRGSSNVVLYDRAGKVIFARSGPLTAAQRAELVDLLRAQLP